MIAKIANQHSKRNNRDKKQRPNPNLNDARTII